LRLARRTKIINAGRHDGDADDTFQAFIKRGADDDVGVLVDLFANAGRGFVDFEQREILAARDGDDETAGALDRGSSINGLEIAATAALSTRFSPEASPCPSWLCPSRA